MKGDLFLLNDAVYGIRCQWQTPVPNTWAARTFGPGTYMFFAQIVAAESDTLAKRMLHQAKAKPKC